jgi:hypothetical protein
LKLAQAVVERPNLKNKLKNKRGTVQVVEPLHSKHKALGSIPSTTKKEKGIFTGYSGIIASHISRSQAAKGNQEQ